MKSLFKILLSDIIGGGGGGAVLGVFLEFFQVVTRSNASSIFRPSIALDIVKSVCKVVALCDLQKLKFKGKDVAPPPCIQRI